MNNTNAVAVYQLTSLASGIVFIAIVYPVAGKSTFEVSWTADGAPCTHHNVPAPLENAVRDAFHSGIYAAAFNGVNRLVA